MSENPSEPTSPLDVRNIHQLVRLMKRYDLSAIDLADGATKIRLRRRGPETYYAAPAYAAPMAPAAPPAQAVPSAAAPAATNPAAPSNDITIESPMVGTFYSSPAPDAPPFVSVGTLIRPDTTVCVIEAMKVFTDIPSGIPSGTTGTISEVLVKNGQSVEFGQALYRVKPS